MNVSRLFCLPWISCLLVLWACTTVCAQMDSPLQGQGTPELETTEVFVSVYLNRLLRVDDVQYLHQNVIYFYVTWVDYSATEKILNSTLKMLNGSNCEKPCSNFAKGVACCDGLYLPSFYFRNAYGFPQDREVGYQIWADDSGAVAWATFVHGIYFQPMDFSNFPFESFELLVELEFFSTHNLDIKRIVENITHPGISVTFSSGGTKLYSTGKGDDTSLWEVTGITLEDDNFVDAGQWFLDYSTIYSAPGDPAPLNPPPDTLNCSQWGTAYDDRCNVYSGQKEQLFAVYIGVQRFWRYYLLNSVLPVVLCGVLAFVVFFLDVTELASRLEVTVTLFLSLTAVQFVLGDKQPASSYVIPTQQLVIATYCFLSFVAVESIIVFHIATRPQHLEAKKRRKEGYLRFLAAREAAKGAAARQQLPAEQPQTSALAGSEDDGAGHDSNGFGSAAGPAVEEGGCAASVPPEVRVPRQRRLLGCFRGAGASRLKEPTGRTNSFKHMKLDEAYAEYVAYMVDTSLACALMFGYILAAVLIFVLQNGYVDIFAET